MKFYILAALVSAASAASILPAGVDPAACPNYPFCGAGPSEAVAALPTPIVQGQPVAPVLNTLPQQTAYYQQAQVATSPAHFPQPIIEGQAVAPVLNTVPAQTRAHENHQLIHAEQQLAQLAASQQIAIAQQQIQIQQQQQIIEAERHFGRL